MSSLTHRRRVVKRNAVERAIIEGENLLSQGTEDVSLVEHVVENLELAMEALHSLDVEVEQEMLLKEDVTDEEMLTEDIEKETIVHRVNRLKQKLRLSVATVSSSAHSPPRTEGKNLPKLPKIELAKFGGEVKDWLPFWSLFQKIDSDPKIDDADKFQYLLQAVTRGTRARNVVESFPPTAGNYRKAVDALKSRFGTEDMLSDHYVRELLKLTFVMSKAGKAHSPSFIYDKVQTQLSSLETLGVHPASYATTVYPLVETCLGAELMRVWRRSEGVRGISVEARLENLMSFLKTEEGIRVAEEGFNPMQTAANRERSKTRTVPTAAELVASSRSGNPSHRPSNSPVTCLFCKGFHANVECQKAQTMTLDERRAILSNHKACFRCTRVGHRSHECRSGGKCDHCAGRHASLMCMKREAESLKPGVSTAMTDTDQQESNLTSTSHSLVYLQTLQVLARGEDGNEIAIRVLFDSGSQQSYIRKDLVGLLGYSARGEVQLQHSVFGGGRSGQQTHKKYKMRLKSLSGNYCCNFDVLDQPVICVNVPSFEKRGLIANELKQVGIELSSDVSTPIDLLIGADIYGKLLTGRREVLKCGLVAFETNLGWIVSGKVSNTEADGPREEAENAMVVTTMFSMVNPESICNLWELDVLGIEDPYQSKSKEKRAQETHQYFLDTVKLDAEERYEVRLPWSADHVPIPRNFVLAKHRLDRTLEKLAAKDNMTSVYDTVFKEWLDERIIEKVEFDTWDKGHYLPHRPVFRDSKTTPVRPVFDASAHERGFPSLNQCLEKGINLIEKIPRLLLTFRMDKIGVISDIRKAFLQISLAEEDRDYLRFLWINEDGTLQIFRHARVVFGVTSSPYLLGAVIDHHLVRMLESSKFDHVLVNRLRKSFYVDNCVTSVHTKEELEQFKRDSISIFTEAKMDLRCWEYTDDAVPVEVETHVLGLIWERKRDTLGVNPASWKAVDVTRVTRKTLLSVAHRVFDPVGFCCPASLCPKLLLQQCWENPGGWQDEIPEHLQVEFMKWYQELTYLEKIRVPRCLSGDGEVESRSVHTFCDASKFAYSAVVFLRSVTSTGIFVQLIQAKSRVAPREQITIPRLELLAALIGARLANSVKEVLGDRIEYVYWSDSSTVIAWINRNEDWGVYLHNRIREILSLSKKEQWRHIPGHLNPADLPSRGCSPKLLYESRWWEGPSWLRGELNSWPMEDFQVEEGIVAAEKRRTKGKETVALVSSKDDPSWYHDLASCYDSTVRLIAWVRRFVLNCQAQKDGRSVLRGELLSVEVEQAESWMWKSVQREGFGEDEARVKAMATCIDETGVIRVKTKVTQRKDTFDFRFPIIVPGDHSMVEKLVLSVHRRACHPGVQGTLSILRDRFWILKGRKVVRKILSKCIHCARFDVKHAEVGEEAALPEARSRNAEVFECTGVDFFGPMELRDGRKVYAVIFTCAVYRAVHLELAVSLSTATFVQALRRFIARRGRPSILYSDNARNFTGTQAAFKNLDWDKLAKFCTVERIDWRFNPPASPWWGGWWERLIGIIKQMLRKTLGKASVSFEEIQTILCDCEDTMNSRPLTYVSEDVSDLVPLTPNHFIRGIKESGVPDCDALSASELGERAQYIQKLRGELRKRFRNEYLGKLARAAKKASRKLQVGEVVLIGSEVKKRLDWPLGRITGFLPGNDGVVRLVTIKTAHGDVKCPIQRVYPLEAATCSGGKMSGIPPV